MVNESLINALKDCIVLLDPKRFFSPAPYRSLEIARAVMAEAIKELENGKR